MTLNSFSMCNQHAAVPMITHNNLLLMKAIKKETILKLTVGRFGLKILLTPEALMPRKIVSIKIKISQVNNMWKECLLLYG